MMSLFPKQILGEAGHSAAWFLVPAEEHKPGTELEYHLYDLVTFFSNGNVASYFSKQEAIMCSEHH